MRFNKCNEGLYGGDFDRTRRYHAVGWDMVTRPKPNGGFGVEKTVCDEQGLHYEVGKEVTNRFTGSLVCSYGANTL
jgi:hypothetical protein